MSAGPNLRSHTHLLSNAVVLPRLRVDADLPRIQDHDLPLDLLPTVLHELTHHWCFNSPVGLALFLLDCQARRAAMDGAHPAPDGQRDDVYDRVQRYEFAGQLMRPLAEGLAMFAEHDAAPGVAATLSQPMLVIAFMFARGLAVRDGKAFEKLPLVLAGARLTPANIGRKADHLVQPLTCRGDGYLPGYLTVKNLWEANLRRSGLFWDSDFFLQYARSFFYDDWTLVARLLDDRVDGLAAMNPILERLQQRLVALATDRKAKKRAAEFERSGVERAGERLELTSAFVAAEVGSQPIGDQPDGDRGRELLQRRFRELFDEWPEDEALQNVFAQDMVAAQLRGTVTLASGRMPGEATDSDLILLAGSSRIALRRPAALADGWKGELDVEVLVGLGPTALYLFLSEETRRIAALPLGREPVPESLEKLFAHLDSRRALAGWSAELLEEILRDGAIEIQRDHARREADRAAEQIYVPRALSRVPEPVYEAVRAGMALNGLFALLGDVALVEDAAAASLCASVELPLESVARFYRWTREPPLAAVEGLNAALAPNLGFAPFFVHRGRIGAAFI